ncbi:hypothetical protein KO566_11020 [Flavobacteriaceae bacterium XHP0103]|uniref:DUF6787 family protein n=1 Tax=Marixanthotalea marina TaxID=2844359 RepID=UPI002989C089|nr:DUF6787 family protein [Marixanthotalea marina]MBU3822596.1 hypothetical protein [Marixanthotalea marina]
MKKFKERWQIQHNWQLLFPFLGMLALIYSSIKLSLVILNDAHKAFILLSSIIIYFLLLKFFLFLFKKLENKWKVTYKWEMISIFLVFATTGSSSVFVGRPVMKWIGITKENLNLVLYWALYIIIGLILYQVLLVFFGWVFGQFTFFWNFEKKMLRRIGFKRFLD